MQRRYRETHTEKTYTSGIINLTITYNLTFLFIFKRRKKILKNFLFSYKFGQLTFMSTRIKKHGNISTS